MKDCAKLRWVFTFLVSLHSHYFYFKTDEERLSKYISRSGVCSRRQAEKMIKEGMIKVDGKVASYNLAVSPRNNVEIFTKRGEKFAPVKQNAKIWLFYKPRGLICSHEGTSRTA